MTDTCNRRQLLASTTAAALASPVAAIPALAAAHWSRNQ